VGYTGEPLSVFRRQCGTTLASYAWRLDSRGPHLILAAGAEASRTVPAMGPRALVGLDLDRLYGRSRYASQYRA
jgi:hypothetical protein